MNRRAGAQEASGFSPRRFTWWKASNFGAPGDYFYFERPAYAFPAVYSDGSPAAGKSLAELWALDKGRFLADAEESSAGLMKQFAQAVDSLAPTISIKDIDGKSIEENGTTNATTILIDATDPTSAGQPVASGIYRVWLTQTAGGTFSSTNTFAGSPDGTTGPHLVQLPSIAGLTDGTYVVAACDGLGHYTQVSSHMADPYFSVGREKLICSAFSAKTHQKSGLCDIHNRKTHALSVTTGHGLVGVRV
jgi:hypothetical protein